MPYVIFRSFLYSSVDTLDQILKNKIIVKISYYMSKNLMYTQISLPKPMLNEFFPIIIQFLLYIIIIVKLRQEDLKL